MTSHRELAAELERALRSEPPGVPIKALLAATLSCAHGGALSRAGMARVGGYSYGSSQTHYADLLTALIDRIPELVAEMAADDIDPALASHLRKDLQDRDRTIAQLRAQLAEFTTRHEQLRRYALALHARVQEAEADAPDLAVVVRMHPTGPAPSEEA